MPVFVALLRAVNVGGTGKLPMADLRTMAEDIGLRDVRTYIQSGNLIFSTDMAQPDAKTALEGKLAAYAAKPVSVILRTAIEMQDILAANPFPDAPPNKVGVLFLDTPAAPDVIETAKGLTVEDIKLGQCELYIHYPSGMGPSKLRMAAMNDGTMRNLNSVGKLAAMAAGA